MTETDPNLELIEKYIGGLDWSSDTPDVTKTVVIGNIRAFYHWSQEHLVNERGDRLEAMIDRMAETNVDLQAKLADHMEFYDEALEWSASWITGAQLLGHGAEVQEFAANMAMSIRAAKGGITQRALDLAITCEECESLAKYPVCECGNPIPRPPNQ